MTGPDQPAVTVRANASTLPPWDEDYDQAPSSPTSPITVPINEATCRAVAKALKASTQPYGIAGPVTAAAAAGLILSELQHLGYWVVPAQRERAEPGA